MAKEFLTNINLNNNEIQNVVIHKLEEFPNFVSDGQVFYHIHDKKIYMARGVEVTDDPRYNTGEWVDITEKATLASKHNAIMVGSDGYGNFTIDALEARALEAAILVFTKQGNLNNVVTGETMNTNASYGHTEFIGAFNQFTGIDTGDIAPSYDHTGNQWASVQNSPSLYLGNNDFTIDFILYTKTTEITKQLGTITEHGGEEPILQTMTVADWDSINGTVIDYGGRLQIGFVNGVLHLISGNSKWTFDLRQAHFDDVPAVPVTIIRKSGHVSIFVYGVEVSPRVTVDSHEVTFDPIANMPIDPLDNNDVMIGNDLTLSSPLYGGLSNLRVTKGVAWDISSSNDMFNFSTVLYHPIFDPGYRMTEGDTFESILSETLPLPKNVSQSGLMSATDKLKLDSATSESLANTIMMRDGEGAFSAKSAFVESVKEDDMFAVVNMSILQREIDKTALAAETGINELISFIDANDNGNIKIVGQLNPATTQAFPVAGVGNAYIVTGDGVISGKQVSNGDLLVAITDAPENTGNAWVLINNNPSDSSTTNSGLIRIATSEEVIAGIDDTTAITPKTLHALVGSRVSELLTQMENDRNELRSYVDTLTTRGMRMVGVIDASSNPFYPQGTIGDTYHISKAGRIGGSDGKEVEAGDMITCIDNTNLSDNRNHLKWLILQTNTTAATEQVAGTVRLATTEEVLSAIDNTTAVSPSKLAVYVSAALNNNRYQAVVGDSESTHFIIQHNLSTRNVQVQTYLGTEGLLVECDVRNYDDSFVDIRVSKPINPNDLRVIVQH